MIDELLARHPLPVIDLADREAVWRALNFNYSMIVASEPLLRIAAASTRGRLADYYLRHLDEERDHARWLLDDLTALSRAPEIDRGGAVMAGVQYWLLAHDRPEALLGYMAVLECRPPTVAVVDAIEKNHGPLKALRHHAEHDPRHGADIIAEMRRLEGDELASAMRSATWTAELLPRAMLGGL